MSVAADFADPHWAFVWPAYGLAVAALVALAWSVARRLSLWAKRAREEEERGG